MIYPNTFEHKLGFDEIRRLLKERCLSTLGKEKVDEMTFSTDCHEVNEWLTQVREFRRLQEEKDDFPMQFFFDVREAISRIRLENTHLEEDEVWDLRRSLETIANIVRYLNRCEDEADDEREPNYPYPALHRLTEGVTTFPAMIRRIDSILDKFGKIKDSASMTLAVSVMSWKRLRAASRVPYILYYIVLRKKVWWKRTLRPRCATAD